MMSRGLSLYLDLLRLVAAVEVFLFHLAGIKPLGVPYRPWSAYGHEAVTVFFVLSGFVIRHAAGSRDTTIESFVTSRLVRIYSVALPCLALTLLLDLIGRHLAPDLYAGLIPHGPAWVRLAIGAAMLNEAWVSVQMLSNTPYWSISYEFWYYFIFAGLFYFTGRQRWILTGLCALIAGPKILLLFPIWVMGWWAYRETLSQRFPTWLSWLLFLQPVAAVMLYDRLDLPLLDRQFLEAVMGHDLWRNGLSWSRYVLSDSFLGVSVALHLMGAKALGPRLWTVFNRVERPIRFCAGQSFTLYLLHQPALLFTGACLATLPLGAWRGACVAVIALAGISLVAAVTEDQRYRIKPMATALVRLISALMLKRQIV